MQSVGLFERELELKPAMIASASLSVVDGFEVAPLTETRHTVDGKTFERDPGNNISHSHTDDDTTTPTLTQKSDIFRQLL